MNQQQDTAALWKIMFLKQLKVLVIAFICSLLIYFIADINYGDSETGIYLKIIAAVPVACSMLIMCIKNIMFEIKHARK